ncbi:MAG: hypothetical protein V4714_02980 [Bacteroidota bacterium]
MGAVFNKSCAKNGVIAYQDSEDQKHFHYLPARIDAVEGSTIRNFQVSYYGINKKPFWVDLGNGQYQSVVGGTLSGLAVPDITEEQKADILKEISEKFGEQEPNLTPLPLSEVKIQPVFAKNIVAMTNQNSQTFPETIQFGSQFAYQISSGNSLFSELVARQNESAANTDFAVNISGKSEFYGDKWVARIQCDLSQVWEYTRTQVNASVGVGFVNIGTQVDKITQELIKTGIVKITYIEGSGGNEFGRQLLETTKKLFEQINAQAVSGEGLFKFEPNPAPQTPDKPKESLGASLLPWSVSVNVAYTANSFKQSISYDQEVSFLGKFAVILNSAMALSTGCNADTQKNFFDIQTNVNQCITLDNRDGLQTRIRTEVAAKNIEIEKYTQWLVEGKIDVGKFELLLKVLNTRTLTEHPDSNPNGTQEAYAELEADVSRILSQRQVYA